MSFLCQGNRNIVPLAFRKILQLTELRNIVSVAFCNVMRPEELLVMLGSLNHHVETVMTFFPIFCAFSGGSETVIVFVSTLKPQKL